MFCRRTTHFLCKLFERLMNSFLGLGAIHVGMSMLCEHAHEVIEKYIKIGKYEIDQEKSTCTQ